MGGKFKCRFKVVDSSGSYHWVDKAVFAMDATEAVAKAKGQIRATYGELKMTVPSIYTESVQRVK